MNLPATLISFGLIVMPATSAQANALAQRFQQAHELML